MKYFKLFFLFFCLSFVAIDFIQTQLEARPGGGSSYRSSGSSSRGSSSSYRSSSSSYRSSGSSYGGGGGGGELSPEAGFAIGTIILLIFSALIFFAMFPENIFRSSEWSFGKFAAFIFSLLLLLLAAYLLLKSGALLSIVGFFFVVFPFVLVFYGFKKLFGTRETIYIAKGKA
jgi:uncharacterized membrane protein